MKKNVIISLVLAALAAGGFFVFDYIYYHRQISSTVFDVSDYENHISGFPSSELYKLVPSEIGLVSDEEAAKENAENYWISVYGDEIKSQKPYYCFFDNKAEVWHITTKRAFTHIWEKNRKGGSAAHLIVQSDGKVLASWLDK